MNFEHDEIERMLADSVRRYAGESCGLDAARRDACLGDGFAPEAWAECAEMGWLGAGLNEASGGFGLGAVGTMIVAEALAGGLSPMPYFPVAGFAAPLLAASGSRGAEVLERLVAGDAVVAVAWNGGADPYDWQRPALRAEARADGWSVSGDAPVVLAGDAASHIIVTAKCADAPGVALFLVPANSPGLKRHAIRLGDNRGAANLTLEGVPLPVDARLDVDGNGAEMFAAAYDMALVTAGAEILGAGQAAFDQTLDYARTRQQFGQPIGKFQVLQHRLVDCSIKLEEARSLIMAAAMALREGRQDARELATAAWVQAVWSGRAVAQEAVQIHGGIGMTDELAIGDYMKRITVNELLMGIPSHHLRRFSELAA